MFHSNWTGNQMIFRFFIFNLVFEMAQQNAQNSWHEACRSLYIGKLQPSVFWAQAYFSALRVKYQTCRSCPLTLRPTLQQRQHSICPTGKSWLTWLKPLLNNNNNNTVPENMIKSSRISSFVTLHLGSQHSLWKPQLSRAPYKTTW